MLKSHLNMTCERSMGSFRIG